MQCDRSEAKSKLASPDTFFFGAPGPFTVELNTDWLLFYTFFKSREVKCLLVSLEFNATGENNVILFINRQHQIDGLHI